ncbi:hypothetical protein DOE73_07400 [Paenibacillus dendritiformis]|nr:hypothetical protein DOE73_07400 [Paenibacillus dendritiformis]
MSLILKGVEQSKFFDVQPSEEHIVNVNGTGWKRARKASWIIVFPVLQRKNNSLNLPTQF